MVDEEIVTAKLRRINEYTNDLEEMRGLSKAAYLDDVVIQRAVERTLMNLIQACVDLAEHVRSTENLTPGDTSKDQIIALEGAGIVSAETRSKLEEAVGFRNVLAHRYGDIDHEVVYTILHEDIHWFERFQTEVARWFRDRSG